jgi:hypothetical protein
MATVAFKKGLLAALPSTYTEGTFYVTTDERAIYLDVDGSTRIRIGDFQEFATLQALQANTNPSTTALYYITDLNVLAKWNGTSYVQINLDTGATSIEVVGDGNTVTAASYDPATRKITLTKGATHTTAEDVSNAIDLAIGELGNKEGDTPYANVKEYVDDKIADVVAGSIEGLGALASKDKVAESDLEATLATKINGKANVGTADDTSDMDTLKGAKKYADEKAAAVQTEVDALEAKVGTVPESKTVVQMIEEAQEAATYDDTEIKAKVQANTNAIGVLNGEATVEGSVKKTVADEIAKVIADAPESFDTLKEISDWISSHSDDAAAMNSAITALQGILDGIGDTESGEKATVVAYVTDAIAALNIGDYATAAQLTALAGRVTTLEGASHTHANKALLDTYTQTEANLADAVAKKHVHANATELDKIAAGDKAKWDAAEQNAKDYADSLASDYDAAGSAAEALADAKEYTDTALTWGSF